MAGMARAVAYLGFRVPGGEVSLGAPNQLHRCKEWVGGKRGVKSWLGPGIWLFWNPTANFETV